MLQNFVSIWLQTAPWFLLGLALSALLYAFMPADMVVRILGRSSRWSVIKAALLGAPLPLCSCSVIPVGLAIRQKGASKGATTSFFISTPETGVDSISLTYAMLGSAMAVIRPVAAVLSAISAGFLVDALEKSEHCSVGRNSVDKPCCACSQENKNLQEDKVLESSLVLRSGMFKRLWAGVLQATGPLLSPVAPWLIVGVVGAAAILTFLPPNFLAEWGQHPLALFIMLVVGIPMYVCASASTPLAAGLLAAGVSPGAILVFLLAGPATNVGTMGVVRAHLGNKALFGYLVGVGGVALLSGFIVNSALVPLFPDLFALRFVQEHAHHQGPVASFFIYSSGLLLALLVIRALWLRFMKK